MEGPRLAVDDLLQEYAELFQEDTPMAQSKAEPMNINTGSARPARSPSTGWV